MKIFLFVILFKIISCTINHGSFEGNYLPPHQTSLLTSSGFGSHSGSFGGGSGQVIPIVRQDAVNPGDGTYQYNYQTGNGISVQEQGDARGDGTKAHGEFSYTSPDGQQIRVQYVADENGFHATGAHLPTPPPIPEAILKSIQQNLAEEARGNVNDGSYNSGHFQGSNIGRGNHPGGYQY